MGDGLGGTDWVGRIGRDGLGVDGSGWDLPQRRGGR